MSRPSQNTKPTAVTNVPTRALSNKELTELLVKHFGLHEGVYGLQVTFQIGFGAVGPDPENPLPGVILGIQTVGLIPAEVKTGNSADAAAINPSVQPPVKVKRSAAK